MFGIRKDGGGVDSDSAAQIALGAVLGLEQSLLAGGGKTALTVLAVAYTNTGKVQGVSLGAGNVVEVYASGADFNDGTVLYREFMNLGEYICFTGLSIGAIITSTQGFYGFSEQSGGSGESPMPLMSYGLSFKSTFLFAFRNSQDYPGQGGNEGWIHVVNGPIASAVTLTDGAGSVIEGQQNIKLEAWQYQRFYTNANQEYILSSTNNIMAGINARMGEARFFDSRLIMPLTNDGITWPRQGFVSAPFDNTVVKYWVRDNAKGSFTVSPGSPIDFDGSDGTGATDVDYEPNGATRVLATGLISAYSGADGSGSEASPLMPTSAMTQVVAQPLFIADVGDGGNSGISIASPFAGTAKIYEYNTSTGALDLAYTVPLTRNGVTITTQEDQYHPASGQVANESVNGSIQLEGQLNPGLIISDVPCTVVLQNGESELQPSIRSQNGTTTTSIVNNDDETLSLGITPSLIAAEIREDAAGLLRRRVISNTGSETWEVC